MRRRECLDKDVQSPPSQGCLIGLSGALHFPAVPPKAVVLDGAQHCVPYVRRESHIA